MKLTQSQMSCSCSRRWENSLCTGRAVKKSVIPKTVSSDPPQLLDTDLPSVFCHTQRLVKVGITRREWKTLVCLPLTQAAILSQLSVAPRWWRTTTARLITPTPAWCRSLCTTWRLCCAARRTSSPTGSSCWGSRTCRASWVCAPASRTLWPPSGGGSWSPWMHFTKVGSRGVNKYVQSSTALKFSCGLLCLSISIFCYFIPALHCSTVWHNQLHISNSWS